MKNLHDLYLIINLSGRKFCEALSKRDNLFCDAILLNKRTPQIKKKKKEFCSSTISSRWSDLLQLPWSTPLIYFHYSLIQRKRLSFPIHIYLIINNCPFIDSLTVSTENLMVLFVGKHCKI